MARLVVRSGEIGVRFMLAAFWHVHTLTFSTTNAVFLLLGRHIFQFSTHEDT